MATPSSSTTSPSPPMASQPIHPTPSASSDPSEKEQRKMAVQNFLARAEMSMVTRTLRARLSYASYKATHNVPHLSLRDLEARTFAHPQPSFLPRTITTKRKATTMNRENATGPTMTGNAHRRGASDSMAPPASVSASRNNHTTTGSGPSSRTGNTLYTSILAPPPSKQARTIHNANEPPIPTTAPAPSPRSRVSRAEGRGRGRGKPAERAPKVSETPSRRRKTSSIDKGKQKQALTDAEMNVDADGDVDMKAAATLTSWLLHNNRQPTVAGSPRSSFDGSETGSTYSHFAQSSTRTTTTATVASAPSPAAASTTSTAEPPARSRTPSPAGQPTEHATPRAAPTDDEAADLMLLFATSPSPVRPTTVSKEARDLTTFRALSGGNNALLSKGRVLFPSSGDIPGTESESSPGGGGRHHQQQYRHQHTKSGPPLVRGGDGSFSSSISSISQLGGQGNADTGNGNRLSRVVSSSQLGPSQLLPPPPLPLAGGTTTPEHAASRRKSATQSPKSSGGQTADFNFSDFINASPSPARAGAGQMLSLGQGLTGSGGGASKPSLGLRADVGRKLFEEEQMRNAASGAKSPRARGGLGAGIDLDAKRSS